MPCADNSMVGPGGKVFVLKPDTWTPYDTEPDTLWGQIEHVDRWIPGYGYYGRMAHDGNRWVSHLQVISAVRGPGVSAVRALRFENDAISCGINAKDGIGFAWMSWPSPSVGTVLCA